jgi:type II secretory pathway component GspD/PulD (secretin)
VLLLICLLAGCTAVSKRGEPTVVVTVHDQNGARVLTPPPADERAVSATSDRVVIASDEAVVAASHNELTTVSTDNQSADAGMPPSPPAKIRPEIDPNGPTIRTAEGTWRPIKLEQTNAMKVASADKPRWSNVLDNISRVLPGEKSAAQGKMVIPDPTEPEPTQQDPTVPALGRAFRSPKARESKAAKSRPEGEKIETPDGYAPITLNLNGADVRTALDLLSRKANVNIMVASDVEGTVTASLRNMSFDEALSAILRLCNLVSHRDGDNVFVYTPENLPELDRVVRVFPLDYVSADEVLKSIEAMEGLLSPVGKAYAYVLDEPKNAEMTDNRYNREAVVIEDAPMHVLRAERYIREVDIQPRQVLIEAYILEVDLKDDLTHGVNLNEVIKVAGNTTTLRTLGFASTSAFPVDPDIQPSGTGFFAKIDGKNFDAILESLKKTTDAKTLAAPKLSVLNGQLAHIQVGEKLGYRDTTTQTETAATQAVEFLELGTVLDVTPRVTANDQIIMTVHPQISTGQINAETELPEENTTEVFTSVLLENGQGIVIGGLIKEQDQDIQQKVPFFGNLPYVGLLFQQRSVKRERTEVIVAIIPRLVPYSSCAAAKDRLEVIRATTPVFHGPMRRCPRPWEPSLRDALPRRGDLL